MPRRRLALLVFLFLAGTAVPGLAAGRPSNVLDSYVLFAAQGMQVNDLHMVDGNVGVNAGTLQIRGDLEAPLSSVAAQRLLFVSPTGACHVGQIFSGFAGLVTPCGTPTVFSPPILDVLDLNVACQFPSPAFTCTGSEPPLTVDAGQTNPLPPGHYGDVLVHGADGNPATLVLQGGEYFFCSLVTRSDARVLFAGASTVHVAGDFHIDDHNYVGPQAGAAVTADAIRILEYGSHTVFLQKETEVHATMCAPGASARLGSDVTLEGRLAAVSIDLGARVVAGPSGSIVSTTTTTLVTTTTSTVPLGCGNGHREANEVCDAPDFGGNTCPGSSTGAFLRCLDGCSRIDFNGCPHATTTTTSITFTSTSTSTSTLPPARCGDGVIGGAEACDPPDFGHATCPGTTTSAGLRCSADCRTVDTSGCPVPAVEQCGNCIDDDGNGLTDFEDTACCAQIRTFRMSVTRGKIIARNGTSNFLLRAILARAGLARVDPRAQDVYVQLKMPEGDVLCARLPADRFVGHGRVFRFVDRQAAVATARGLTNAVVRIRPDGTVLLVARGKQARLAGAHAGSAQVTVGFRGASASGGDSRCSTTTQTFRTGRTGSLLAP